MTKTETIALQRKLAAAGLYNPNKIDGIYGDKTKFAHAEYLASLPIPDNIAVTTQIADAPWWRTRRAIGLVVGAAGLIAQATGNHFDSVLVADLVYQGLELGGQVVAYAGALISLWGAWNAKSKIDSTLVARVGANDIRLPHRVYNDEVPPNDPFGSFRAE